MSEPDEISYAQLAADMIVRLRESQQQVLRNWRDDKVGVESAAIKLAEINKLIDAAKEVMARARKPRTTVNILNSL